jgi:hypothetical protein
MALAVPTDFWTAFAHHLRMMCGYRVNGFLPRQATIN